MRYIFLIGLMSFLVSCSKSDEAVKQEAEKVKQEEKSKEEEDGDDYEEFNFGPGIGP
jgi:hypothetical protein